LLINDVFERRTSTGSRLFAFLSCDFEQTFGQIVSIIVESLSNTNLVASKHIQREKSSLPVDVPLSKMLVLKLPITCEGGGGGHFARAGYVKTSVRLSGTGRNLVSICEPLT